MTCGAVRTASHRAKAIGHHMMSTTTSSTSEPTVKFESNSALRSYILDRPLKRNALDEQMLTLLRPKIEEWSASDLCGTIVGRGSGPVFCSGGDVASVVQNAADPATRPKAMDFFKREFEMDYILAALKKPYVVIMDGVTMGGGVGLAAPAPFRVATENTQFAMPEAKIGYFPDVGGSYFLSRLDGEIGTYLALTSQTLKGRAVFEYGFATHFIPSRRIPMLLDRLAELDQPHPSLVDHTLEELSSERDDSEPPALFTGRLRVALDSAFRHDSVERIFKDLRTLLQDGDATVRQWASDSLEMLAMRSPTSLKVALKAIRRGKRMTLREALEMELKIASAYCSGASPDFDIGVKAVLIEKLKTRPEWSPSSLEEVSEDIVSRFFEPTSPYVSSAPRLEIPEHLAAEAISIPMRYALPSENEIGAVIRGSHSSGGEMGTRAEDVLARFAELRPGKLGVKEKVLEVIQRRCKVTDNADGNFVWLKWIH